VHEPHALVASLDESKLRSIQFKRALGVQEIVVVAASAAEATEFPERIVSPFFMLTEVRAPQHYYYDTWRFHAPP
jgi:acyl dehydratase